VDAGGRGLVSTGGVRRFQENPEGASHDPEQREIAERIGGNIIVEPREGQESHTGTGHPKHDPLKGH